MTSNFNVRNFMREQQSVLERENLLSQAQQGQNAPIEKAAQTHKFKFIAIGVLALIIAAIAVKVLFP